MSKGHARWGRARCRTPAACPPQAANRIGRRRKAQKTAHPIAALPLRRAVFTAATAGVPAFAAEEGAALRPPPFGIRAAD